MSISSVQQLNDSCGKVTQSSTASCDYRNSVNGNHLAELENNRKLRREIANSNERKRMECINTGFQALKMLLPHKENEKLSKAMILQQTAQYILSLEKDKTVLLQQNTTLKRLLTNCECQNVDERPPVKRQRCESQLSSEEMKSSLNKSLNPVYSFADKNELMVMEDKTYSQHEQEQNFDILKNENKQSLDGMKTEISNDMEKTKSGQNLETIILAIKHVEEGETEETQTPTKEHMFNERNVYKSSKRIII